MRRFRGGFPGVVLLAAAGVVSLIAQSGPRRRRTPEGEALHHLDGVRRRRALGAVHRAEPDQQDQRVAAPGGLDLSGHRHDRVQPDRRRRRDVRAGHRQRDRGARRRHRQGDLDATRTRAAIGARGLNYWESPDRVGPPADLSERRQHHRHRRPHRRDHHVVRQQRPRGPAHGAVAATSATRCRPATRAGSSTTSSSCRCRRRAPATRPTRPTCRPTTSAPARCGGCSTPSRCPGEFGYDTWPDGAFKTAGGVHNWSELTVDEQNGIVFIPIGTGAVRLLRRQPSRREPVRQQHRGARRAHRQAAVAPAAGAPRPVGLRPAAGAEAAHAAPERPQRRRGGAGHEDGLRVRVRAQDRRAVSSRSRSGRCRRPTCRAR